MKKLGLKEQKSDEEKKAHEINNIADKEKGKKVSEKKAWFKRAKMDKDYRSYSMRFYSGIGVKLIMSFLFPVIFVIIVGVVSYENASKAILNNYRTANKQAMEVTGDYIRFGLDFVEAAGFQYTMEGTIQKYFNGKYKNDMIQSSMASKDIKSLILAKEVSDDFIENIYILSDEMGMISTRDKTDEELYKEFLETENGKALKDNFNADYWIGAETLIDKKLDTNPKSYAIRYIRGFPDSKSCVIIDVNWKAIKSILSGLNFGKGSIISFVTSDGREIMASETVGIDPAKAIFSSKEFGKNTANTFVIWNGKKYLYLVTTVGKTGASICALIPYSMMISEVSSIKNVTLGIVFLACFIAIVIGLIIASGIQKVIHYVINELKRVSEGNLTVKLKVRRADEFQTLSQGVNSTIENMRKLIKQISVQSNTVTDSSVRVKASSEVFTIATRDITEAINEIQQGVSQQAKDSENCLMQMDGLSEKIEVVSGKTNEINMIANETKSSIMQGMSIIQTLNEKAQSTSEITEQIIHNIEILEQKSLSISKIVGTINSIAEETNLLSLNASIEAARAGAAGSGFKVVAEEIRKLADQSVIAVHEIETLINEIQTQTKDVVKIANRAESVIEDQETAVNNTERSFQDMNQHVDKLVNNVSMILGNINNIEATKHQTLIAIENISAVSQQTAAATLSVNEITEHQLNAVDTLNNLSKELDDNAKILESIIKQFKIS